MHQLVTELLRGVRLPKPESCPISIASLIEQCFAADASYRPSFDKIKFAIETDYALLGRASKTSTETASSGAEELQYADLEFEQRYLEMRIRNQDLRETKNLQIEETVNLDARSLTASFKNEALRYISLSDMTSSKNPIISVTTETQPSLIKQTESTENEVVLRAPRRLLSPGSSEYKRFFSYGGEDPTPELQPERLKTNPLLPARSYPNPTYMTFPSTMNSNTTVDDAILNKYYQISKI